MGSLSEEVRTEVLCGHICDLEAENAKLRERVAELEKLEDGKLYIPQEWYQLVTTENAKLRNEVDNLLDFEHLTSIAVAYAGCDECGEYKQTMLRLFDENAKLRELVVSYDSALRRMCDQMQRYVDCHDCILGKDYSDDSCAIDELREAACVMGVEL